jgi:xylan 1,4-beta-xylosidase
MIQNPILKGFCPDPSIIRVREDYYIATSTFEWWPGVKLFHSRDLQNWEQIASPLRRGSQLNMVGNPTSGGIWAPCLSYDGSYYYLIFTDVKTKKGRYYNTHNYLIYTDDIYREWSEPVYLNSIGFDPSLFHDSDGKKYLINMVNGFKGVLIQEIEPGSWKLVGERKKIYAGSGIGCTEGPHLYHIGDWYYLIVAEGGTGYEHCVTMARSKSIWGPFETAPNNPILTSDREDINALQKCGHADFVDTQYGEWYMVHLCSRPLNGRKWCTLGRETAIQKMYWDEEGWLRLKSRGRFARLHTETPCGIQEQFYENEAKGFFDDFGDSELNVRYCSPRCNMDGYADCKTRKGYLRLTGKESLNSLHHVSLVAVRQQAPCCKAEIAMEFTPDYPEQLAGLTYMYDAMNFYILGKTVTEEGNTILTLIKSNEGVVTDEVIPISIPREGEIRLRVEVSEEGTVARFYYQTKRQEWFPIGQELSTEILTDEHCRGFTGAHFGMYIHDMTGLSYQADFDYLKVET